MDFFLASGHVYLWVRARFGFEDQRQAVTQIQNVHHFIYLIICVDFREE